jgi:hypothetical protein
VAVKIRSACGPLIRDHEKELKSGSIEGIWKFLTGWVFWRKIQRRGTHVSTPKKGSRGDAFCIGGILGFYAVLRRDFKRGNFILGFFVVLLVVLRRCIEEGGQLVCTLCNLGGI